MASPPPLPPTGSLTSTSSKDLTKVSSLPPTASITSTSSKDLSKEGSASKFANFAENFGGIDGGLFGPDAAKKMALHMDAAAQAAKAAVAAGVAAASIGGEKEEKVGGYVTVEDVHSLSPEAFEISEELTQQALGLAKHYNFQRSARRSILLSLGVAPTAQSNSAADAAMDPYSKLSEKACSMTYMVVMVGFGTLDLSTGISACGVFPWLSIIVGFHVFHGFMCFRILEVPQLIQQNIENYTGLAKACFGNWVYKIFVFMSVWCWSGTCTLYLKKLLNVFQDAFALDCDSVSVWILKGLCLVVLMPTVLKTSAKHLTRCAKYSMYAILSAGLAEVFSAVFYGLGHLQGKDHKIKWFGEVGDCIYEGLPNMLLSFAGIGLLPYIVAEMLNPQNAQKMVKKASDWVFRFYLIVGLITYFGWGDSDYSPIMRMVVQENKFYRVLACLMSVCFMVKTIVTYPLFFWPLCREIETFLALDQSPPIELQLPWAVRHQQRTKSGIRVILVIFTFLPLLQGASFNFFHRIFITFAVNFVHYLFPALLCLVAAVKHKHLLEDQARASRLRPSSRVQEVKYIFGNVNKHILAVALATGIMTVVCLVIAIDNLETAPAQEVCSPRGQNLDVSNATETGTVAWFPEALLAARAHWR